MPSIFKKFFILFLAITIATGAILVYLTYFTQAKTIPKRSYSKKFLLKVQSSAQSDLIISSNNRIIYPINITDIEGGKGSSIKEMRIFNPKTKKSRAIPNLMERPRVYDNYGLYLDTELELDTINLINLSTGNKQIIARDSNLWCPDITKNYVTFAKYIPAYGYGTTSSNIIYIYNRKTRTSKQLFVESNLRSCPVVSGKRVAWVSGSRPGIYLMDITKTQPRRIAKIQTGYYYDLVINSSYVLYRYTNFYTQYKLNLYKIAKRKTTNIRTLKANSVNSISDFNLVGNAVYWKEDKKTGKSTNINYPDPYKSTIYYYDVLQKKKYRLASSSKYDYQLSAVNKGSLFLWVRVAKLNNSPLGQGYVYKITVKK